MWYCGFVISSPASISGPSPASLTRLGEPSSERLVVVGDRDHVEPGPGSFVSQHPWRERAVTRRRVHVEVAGQHQVAAGTQRLDAAEADR